MDPSTERHQELERQGTVLNGGGAVLKLLGLPYSISEEKIRDFFGSFCLADEEPVVFFSDGPYRGMGFVRLHSAEDVPAVIGQLNRRQIDGNRYVEITESSEEERHSIMQQHQDGDRALVLRLRGLPFHATENDVRTFIGSVEGVLKISMCVDMEGRNTGDAFIELATEDDVQSIRRLHGSQMGSRYIEVLTSTAFDRDAILRVSSLRPRRVRRGVGVAYEMGASTGATSQRGPETMTFQRFVDPIFSASYDGYVHPLGFGGQRPAPHQFHGGLQHGPHHNFQAPHYYHPQQQQQHHHHHQAQPFHHYGGHNNFVLSARGNDGRHGRHSAGNQQQRRHVDDHGVAGDGAEAAGAAGYGAAAPPFVPVFHGQSSVMVARQPSQHVVRIRGAPYTATEEAIAQFFSGVRIPPQGVHMVYDERNRPTGEAFVEVEDRSDVIAALGKNGEMMGVRYIEVFESSPAAMHRMGSAHMGMMSYPMMPQMFC